METLPDICKEIAKNAAMAVEPVRRWRLTSARSAVLSKDDAGLERYAFQPLRGLLGVLGSVRGLRILEIGPGDNLTSGLSLLAAGAKSYTVIERFAPDYSRAEAKNWYKAIQGAWHAKFPEITWPVNLEGEQFPEAYTDRVHVVPLSIEKADMAGQFDIICSYQVLEHVTDIAAFAQQTARLLASNGTAVHRVDFGPHDCWLRYSDPFTFLRFPDWLWTLMGSQRGTPNRRRFHECNEALTHAGFEFEVVGREIVARDRFDRAQMAKRFQSMPVESLETITATYVCRRSKKPVTG